MGRAKKIAASRLLMPSSRRRSRRFSISTRWSPISLLPRSRRHRPRARQSATRCRVSRVRPGATTRSSSPEGGDAWFGTANGWYNNPVVGNYGWLTMIHETGHTLGLKHPQDVMGSFGATPASVNSLEYSVMSYRSYIGASTTQGLTNATWSFPTTLMMYDIAALQYMYGANYYNTGHNTVYQLEPQHRPGIHQRRRAGRARRQHDLHDGLGWRRHQYVRFL